MNAPTTDQPAVQDDAPIFREAFERVRAEAEAVPEAELLPVNIDVGQGVTTVLGHVHHLASLRAQAALELPRFAFARFDKLRDYAMAAYYTNILYQNSIRPTEPLPELGEIVQQKREVLLADLTALTKRGLIQAPFLDDLRGPNGYRAVAEDLERITSCFRAHWSSVHGRTAVTEQELTEAEQAASRLLGAVGRREATAPTATAAQLTRQRAYTLFMRAYDDARRAVIYLRWHEGDADDFAPSLYAGRGGRKKPEEGPSESSATGAQPEPGQPQPPASAPTPNALPGMPGASPFV